MARAQIKNSELEILPGSLLDIELLYDEKEALSVADTSIIFEDEKKFVYKIGSNIKSLKTEQVEFNLNQEKFIAKIDSVEIKETSFTKKQDPEASNSSVNLLNTFIPGKRNLLAIRACKAVVEMPAIAFNPFVIYGESGSGKSHLLEGINNEMQHVIPNKQVLLSFLIKASSSI